MPCYLCKQKSPFYQRLDRSRARFMRKVYTEFKDSSYLCTKCFQKFERIFRSKKKSKLDTSNMSIASSATLRTVSSKTSSRSTSDTSDKHLISSKENTQSNGSVAMPFAPHTLTPSSKDSVDSTDMLVHMISEIATLHDSAVGGIRNPEVAVAREGAQAAIRSVLRRKRNRDETEPPSTPKRSGVIFEDDDAESEIHSVVAASDLVVARPVVKRRKEPVVYLNKDVMDIYLADTSGG